MNERSYIYVIGHPDGPKKIGITSSPSRRFSELQTASPVPLFTEFVGVCGKPAARVIENLVHRLLAEHRRHGEWFAVGIDDAVAAVMQAASHLGYEIKPSNSGFPDENQTQTPDETSEIFAEHEKDLPEDALISPAQCRAARALLGMSQDRLASLARMASKTVLRFEKGEPEVKPKTPMVLRMILEREGVLFLDGNGVAKKN